MGIKVDNLNDCVSALEKVTNSVTKIKSVRAIQSSLLIGALQASIYTPIDTSMLINSQFREIIVNGSIITGRVGYTANYAHYVADPNIEMTFRRKTAKKDFLNAGFEETKQQRDAVIAKEMSL